MQQVPVRARHCTNRRHIGWRRAKTSHATTTCRSVLLAGETIVYDTMRGDTSSNPRITRAIFCGDGSTRLSKLYRNRFGSTRLFYGHRLGYVHGTIAATGG